MEKMDEVFSVVKVGSSVDIRRTDGRIHSAMVSKVDCETLSVMVEWFEQGEVKGKYINIETLLSLNPHLTAATNSSNHVVTKNETTDSNDKSETSIDSKEDDRNITERQPYVSAPVDVQRKKHKEIKSSLPSFTNKILSNIFFRNKRHEQWKQNIAPQYHTNDERKHTNVAEETQKLHKPHKERHRHTELSKEGKDILREMSQKPNKTTFIESERADNLRKEMKSAHAKGDVKGSSYNIENTSKTDFEKMVNDWLCETFSGSLKREDQNSVSSGSEDNEI